MREIKFRAWDNLNKYMIYPDFPKGDLRSSDILQRWNPEWIMQFTGLLDKNGKEIYEGDIVNIGCGVGIKKVIWAEDTACFEGVTTIGSRSLYGYVRDGMEVIGNIYENGDLLNGKN